MNKNDILKLIKYDIKYIMKSQIIFYILPIITSLTMSIVFIKIDIPIYLIIYWILFSISAVLIIGIITNNIIKLWSRFINNLYNDESYLTHTLPIKINKIYLSKILTTIITLLISITIILIIFLIITFPTEGLDTFNSLLKGISFNGTTIKDSLINIYIIYEIELLLLTMTGYLGITLGHKSNENKLSKSVLYSFILYIIILGLTLLVLYIISLFNSTLLELFQTNKSIKKEAYQLLRPIIITMHTIIIIIIYITNTKLLKKGVNID